MTDKHLSSKKSPKPESVRYSNKLSLNAGSVRKSHKRSPKAESGQHKAAKSKQSEDDYSDDDEFESQRGGDNKPSITIENPNPKVVEVPKQQNNIKEKSLQSEVADEVEDSSRSDLDYLDNQESLIHENPD